MRYQGNISCKDEHDKGQKQQGPNRSRRAGKNTQKNYTKKGLNDPDNNHGVVTHLEPDSLECEGKRALGSITTKKAHGSDRIPVELVQILKDEVVKVLHSVNASKSGKLSSGHRTRKGQFSFQSQRKAMRKNVQTTAQ